MVENILASYENGKTPEDGIRFSHEFVYGIERYFAKAELKSLCNTFKGVVVRPMIEFILKKVNKYQFMPDLTCTNAI